MPIEIRCPSCEDVFPVTEDPGNRKLDCPNCGAKFAASQGPVKAPGAKCPACGTLSSLTPTDKPQPTTCAGCKQRFTVAPRGDAGPTKTTDPTPKTPSRPKSTTRRRFDADDNDDDVVAKGHRPTGRTGKKVGLIALGGAGALLVLAVFGVIGYLIFAQKHAGAGTGKAVAQAVTEPPPVSPPARGPAIPPARGPVVPQPAPVNPPPGPIAAPATALPGRVISLPGPAGTIRIGGGGRYLFIHLKTSRQVTAFDLATEKIVHSIPVADDDAVIAAGLTHLIVGYPRQKLLTRYSLATFEKDATIDVPSQFPLQGLGLGAGSNGPLLVGAGHFRYGEEFFLIDTQTMQRLPGTEIRNAATRAERDMQIWASNEGRVFSARSTTVGSGATFQARPGGWVVARSPCEPPVIAPDGDLVFGKGMMANVGGGLIGGKVGGHGKEVWYIPAAQGPFFLSLNERVTGVRPNARQFLLVGIHAGRDHRPLLTLPEFPETTGLVDWLFGVTKPFDQHIFYFPRSNRLLLLPPTRDSITIRTIDLKAELANTGGDYLVLASGPPTAIKRQLYQYAPDVWSNRGGVKLRLEYGPTGMVVDGNSLVWTVPPAYSEPNAAVILVISDASGRESRQTFEISVVGAN